MDSCSFPCSSLHWLLRQRCLDNWSAPCGRILHFKRWALMTAEPPAWQPAAGGMQLSSPPPLRNTTVLSGRWVCCVLDSLSVHIWRLFYCLFSYLLPWKLVVPWVNSHGFDSVARDIFCLSVWLSVYLSVCLSLCLFLVSCFIAAVHFSPPHSLCTPACLSLCHFNLHSLSVCACQSFPSSLLFAFIMALFSCRGECW